MQSGENEQGLRKIIDLTRWLSLAILIIHFYIYCYSVFSEWKLTTPIVDHIMLNFSRMGVFRNSVSSKVAALILLAISLLGAKGKKKEEISRATVVSYISIGFIFYSISHLFLLLNFEAPVVAIAYMTTTMLGYILMLTGGTLLSRLINVKLKGDIFNAINESFPQEERLIENEFSINLPTQYKLKGQVKKGWINIINPFRALLIIGTPGAGKSYFIIRHVITQHIQKGFTMFLYDFKYDDLARIAYNALLKYYKSYKIIPKFYVINFDQIIHRCNPLEPSAMFDITDATESARTIMLGLNREWIKKQGDFFVESPINFVTAIMWFLRKYQDGKYCTLPHVIELMQIDYTKLFSVLRTEPEIEALINPFVSAYINDAMDQLEGQVASAKICMARLSSPQLYYVLSGNDFTLDINNPNDPKIVCIANNPQKQQIYGAVISLYNSRVIRLVNRKNQLKCSVIFDEFSTTYNNGIDGLIATARANKVATTLAVQDHSQLKKDYGRDQAEVIINISGNVISGQVVGETAKILSDRFGKIVQERESLSINTMDTSLSKSTQLDAAIPPSKIAALSSGEFVGMVADDPNQKIELKVFHAEIVNDHDAIRREESNYKDIPQIRAISRNVLLENYLNIKHDIQNLVESEISKIKSSPDSKKILITKTA